MTNFSFLQTEYPLLFNLGQSAEQYIHTDPSVALMKMRLFGEKVVEIIFEIHQLQFPYDDNTFRRLQLLSDERLLETNISSLLHDIRRTGNKAAHTTDDHSGIAMGSLFGTFKIAKWFYLTYSQENNDISEVKFHPPEKVDKKADYHKLEAEFAALEEKFNLLINQRPIGNLPKEEQKSYRERSVKASRNIDMSEAETRALIDAQLREAGWEVNTQELNYKRKGTLPVKGSNLAIAEWKAGSKWADYALFIGTQLYGIVEAKKYAHDISTDLHQSKRYAELVEAVKKVEFLGEWDGYRAPFLFSTNGRTYLEQLKTKSGIWFLDVRQHYNISRSLQGWFSPEGLKKLWEQDIQDANQKLLDSDIKYLQNKSGLNLRDYQINAIQKVEQTLIDSPDVNRVLLAMATGTGKTRTITGLCYRLIKSNRFKRILFLADRRLLATQASDAFEDNRLEDLQTFSGIYNVEGLKAVIPDIDTRLHFATVQSMVKRLFYADEETSVLSIDTYDCIIVDEAHRGYLLDREMDDEELNFKDQNDYVSKYRRVIDYFDAVAIGLTATPALHTTEIFGKPVFTYSYREAVIDGFLIDHEPPYQINTKLSEEGIVWQKGEKPKAYDREANKVVELAELEDELSIEIEGFNKMVITEPFNRTVIKQLVQLIDPDGDEKTLVFAATDEHADLVVNCFKEEYDNIGVEVNDNCIKKITGKSYDPAELFKRFKNEKFPNIAVTVDLLTTGIDVPPITNLVFLRRVKSRILFEQMMGRATRLCPEINKEIFRIYDAVRLYEVLEDYTNMKPVTKNPDTTFIQLVNEMNEISSIERARKQVEQIIAKLQRKKRYINGDNETKFNYVSGAEDIDKVIQKMKEGLGNDPYGTIRQFKPGFWKFLDELRPAPPVQLISEHEDEFRSMGRGYGKGQKPEDYLLGFEQYIKENINKIAALQIICSRPKELDRKSLKEFYLLLDEQGYNTRTLNSAWKDAKNETIAADIISFIRTLALGDALVSHEERIRKAVQKVRESRTWNAIQLKWLEKFEKQLLVENVLRADDLNEDPFKMDGGFTRLNKIFENELEKVIELINENLYVTA
jgi:type I restriction enzyme R subunit